MIFYFSATGNSEHVATSIARITDDEAVSILDYPVRFPDGLRIGEGERLGLVSPTYSWCLPTVVREFIGTLKVGFEGNPYVFFVATYGSVSGAIGKQASKLLKRYTGVDVDALFDVRLPDTWTPIFDLSDRDENQKVIDSAEIEIVEMIPNIVARKTGNFMKKPIPGIVLPICNMNYDRMRKTDNFSVDDTCIGCRRCERGCPVGAIEMRDGKPVWRMGRCAMCLRCLHRCPSFAIQYGSRTRDHGQYVFPAD